MPQIKAVISPQDLARTKALVAETNAKVNNGKLSGQNLGKDDFLKLLVTQLANQDPTAPVKDTQFIAQMAQFSSLEQMTNMASDFAKMTSMTKTSEAASALGKSVDINDGTRTVSGRVDAVLRGDVPQVQVKGQYYNWDDVTKVYEPVVTGKENSGL